MKLLPLKSRISPAEGPFVSVYLDSSHDTEDAEKQQALRWRAVRSELAEQDADEPTLEAVNQAMRDQAPAVGRAGRCVIAAHGAVVLDEPLDSPPASAIARVSALPYLLPFVDSAPRTIPHVVALPSRLGAELWAVDARGVRVEKRAMTGRRKPVHKVRGGGSAHAGMQHRSEETSRHNVDEVAPEVARLVDLVGARIVIIGGEVQARSALRDALPERCREATTEVSVGGGTHAEDRAVLHREVRRILGTQAEFDDRVIVESFEAEAGRANGLATRGLTETTRALREAKVDVLLVADVALGDQPVYTGSSPDQVAVDPDELVGVDTPARRRADEALPAAALETGAEIVVTDRSRLTEEVGALLRHR
jgi:hypothetical protein